MIKKLLIFFLFLFSLTCGFPQPAEDTTFLSAAIQASIDRFHQAIRGQSKLYNGSKYVAPDHTIDEHPFFNSEDWLMGDVFYDGELFKHVPLMYDIMNEELITEHYSSGHPIQLIFGKLDYFSIAGHNFIKIEKESSGGSLPATTFYDILYAGETQLIARYQKYMRDRIQSQQIERSFEEKVQYFIFKNGVFFPVRNRGSVLKILGDEKQPLKKFLKTNNIFYSQNRERALKKLVEFYDTLKKEK